MSSEVRRASAFFILGRSKLPAWFVVHRKIANNEFPLSYYEFK